MVTVVVVVVAAVAVEKMSGMPADVVFRVHPSN